MVKPILFNTEMVRAILAGHKTMTRRLIKPRYRDDECGFQVITNAHTGKFVGVEKLSDQGSGLFPDGSERYVSPPCQPGDILYVRETWSFWPCFDCDNEMCYGGETNYKGTDGCFVYKTQKSKVPYEEKWRPSIHMPKEAARIFLRVAGVHAERLQDITDEQCMYEGIQQWSKDGKLYKYAPADSEGDYPMWPWKDTPIAPRGAFAKLWDSTVKTADISDYGFSADPWVWVIEFERCEKPEGF